MRDLRILIIDDEPAIARAVRPALQAQGFTVTVAPTGADALAQLESAAPDLILLDLGLPDVDGVTLLQQIRARLSVPVIVLSVRGADYLTKPFSMGELLARVRVALRHGQQTPAPAAHRAPITIGAVVLDPEQHTVTARGQAVH